MRGLVIRSDNRAYTGISRILALFEDDAMGRDAARSMVILSRESDNVIAKENYSVIRVGENAFIAPKTKSLICLRDPAVV